MKIPATTRPARSIRNGGASGSGGGNGPAPARPGARRILVRELEAEGFGPLDPSQLEAGFRDGWLLEAEPGIVPRQAGQPGPRETTVRLPASPSSYAVGRAAARAVAAVVRAEGKGEAGP